MKMQSHFLFFGLLLLTYAVSSSKASLRPHARVLIDPNSEPLATNYGLDTLNRSSFPKGFIFGSGTSAYQIEGAWNTDGKGPSVWDTFTHNFPEKIRDRSNGDVAVDFYHRYKEDVETMKTMNLDAYRFSIAWSRVLPRGKLSKGVNEQGIKYYNNLINELLSKGLTPVVTLYHWDLPQALEDEYSGFLSPHIVDDFRDYAELCFKIFGDRVKYWTTVNEPWGYSSAGYGSGNNAPGRCSSWVNPNCTNGDSSTEPYLATHYQLLAHATVVKLYKQKYQALQKGKIGLTLVSTWMVPNSNSKLDRNAAQRALDFMLGWCLEPLVSGNYPRIMQSLVGKRLPKFTREQSKMLIGSFDFLGLNYYTAYYVSHVATPNSVNMSYATDSLASLSVHRNGTLIGEQAGSEWLHVYPRGIYDLLLYIKRKYNNPLIYITENGIDEINNATLSLKQALVDNFRIRYYYQHLSFVRQAIRDGVNVMAYFAWSTLDNFEFTSGYTSRFGLNYVDYQNGLKRYSKLSAKWFTNFLKK